jgi:hypothetical protein
MSVTVRDGILTIAGRPETNEVGHEIVATLRHLEGGARPGAFCA